MAHTLEVIRSTAHLREIRPLMQRRFHCLRPLLPQQVIHDLLLGFEVDLGVAAGVLEMQPFHKFFTGIQRQVTQLQQQFRGSIADDPKAVHQFAVHIVVDLESDGFMTQQHSAAAAKDFDKTVVFLREYGVENRQQIRLVADTGNWGIDRLFHAPFHNRKGRYIACAQQAVPAGGVPSFHDQ